MPQRLQTKGHLSPRKPIVIKLGKRMKRSETLPLAFAVALLITPVGKSADPSEPFLRQLPPGVAVERSVAVPAAQTKAIGQKLGGDIQRLTNSIVRVHGRSIQVNAITAVDESNAKTIQAALGKIKSYPFCTRKGQVVIEYVGRNIDAPLAIKTSYELGLRAKPERVRYRVIADLATVEKADYMACNTLFNQFLAVQDGTNQDAIRQIKDLSTRFEFGRSLVLRKPSLDDKSTKHAFRPTPIASKASGATIAYSFGELTNRQGIPFVTATIETTVDDSGYREATTAPAEHLTVATSFWPTDDPRVRALARRITAGKSTNGAKAMAILKWLSPGQNLKYSGQTGSRWGTLKVFEQKFGHCWDFSDCFVTLARAAGVPSRQVAGWFYGSSGHVWAEFYREGRKGWQQVDPTGGGKLPCGIYHIPYFTSEDGEMPILYVSMPKIEAMQTR